jgi:hypothetical protein
VVRQDFTVKSVTQLLPSHHGGELKIGTAFPRPSAYVMAGCMCLLDAAPTTTMADGKSGHPWPSTSTLSCRTRHQPCTRAFYTLVCTVSPYSRMTGEPSRRVQFAAICAASSARSRVDCRARKSAKGGPHCESSRRARSCQSRRSLAQMRRAKAGPRHKGRDHFV